MFRVGTITKTQIDLSWGPGDLLELTAYGRGAVGTSARLSFEEPIMLLKKTYNDEADGSSWEILVSRKGEAKIETWIILPSYWRAIT